MKKIFLLLFIFIMPLQALAFEDYIILSETKVDSVYSNNKDIVEILPFYTIDNNKKSIFLKAKNVGKAILTISTESGEKVIDVEISENKTELSGVEGLSYFPLDIVEGGQ